MCNNTRSRNPYELTMQNDMVRCQCRHEFIPEGIPVECPRCKSIRGFTKVEAIDHSRNKLSGGKANHWQIEDFSQEPPEWEQKTRFVQGVWTAFNADCKWIDCKKCPDKEICDQ